MSQHSIYWPILAQVLIPFLILILNGKRKATDVKSGNFDRERAAMDNEAWSKPVVLTSKNLANQFQLPVLFYVLCLVLASIDGVTVTTLSIAWIFVATRYLHAYVHVTSNYIPLRMNSFLAGVVSLLVLLIFTASALI